MDYTHNPYLIVVLGGLGVLIGVLFTVMALVMFRRPKSAAPDGDEPSGEDGG